MKRLVSLFAALFLLTPSVYADPFLEFQDRIKNELLKPFALDLGGLLGATTFRPGKSLGFPGFQVRAIGVFQTQADKNNLVMRNAGVKAFGFPMLEGAMGLPFKIDLIVRGLQVERLGVYGGGVRVGLIDPGLAKFIPHVGVSAFAHKVIYPAFNANHFAMNAEATWKLPFIHPYIGAGFDITKATIGSAGVTNLLAGTAETGISATARGSRFAVGVDVTPFPFSHVTVAYTLNHGLPGGLFSLGARF